MKNDELSSILELACDPKVAQEMSYWICKR